AAAEGGGVGVGKAGGAVGAPAGAADLVGLVGGGQFFQPGRLGQGVVVDEGHEVAGRLGDADVARLAEVDLAAVGHAHVGELGEDRLGVVGGRPVDGDHLEGVVRLVAQGVQGVSEARPAVVGVNHHADARARTGSALSHDSPLFPVGNAPAP